MRSRSVTVCTRSDVCLVPPFAVAICVNNFTFHYTLYMLMNWLPTFFSAYLGGSLAAMGNAKVLPYLIMFATSNLG